MQAGRELDISSSSPLQPGRRWMTSDASEHHPPLRDGASAGGTSSSAMPIHPVTVAGLQVCTSSYGVCRRVQHLPAKPAQPASAARRQGALVPGEGHEPAIPTNQRPCRPVHDPQHAPAANAHCFMHVERVRIT
eukprot:366256-Chlamydomonas_euryale.AAC.8